MVEDKTWNVFIDNCGFFCSGCSEAKARSVYKQLKSSGRDFETLELVHDEQTIERYDNWD